MSDTTDEILFTGGLNSDDEPRFVSNQDYIGGLNLMSGIREAGAVVNQQGNTLQPYTLPSGRNKCIGAIRDIKRNAIIYFVWNENEDHSILHYFCETKTIEEIFAPKAALPVTGIPFTTAFLSFTEFNKIHSANILDDILLWTDGAVHPAKINIKRAKDFMLQLTPSAVNTPYDNLIAMGSLDNKLQFIRSIKYAPQRPAEISLGTDVTKTTNFIRNKMLQVRYRWVYDDNEKSRWNTGSFVSLPVGQENYQGLISSNVSNNYLAVTYNTGHPTAKWVEIAFSFDNLGIWYKLDEPIKKYDEDNQRVLPDFTDEIFNFYNDRTLIPVDPSDTGINYDSIPLVSATQEIIDSNRLVYANNTEGYENPDLIVSTTFGNTLTPMNDVVTDIVIYDATGLYESVCIPYNQTGMSAGDIISFSIAPLPNPARVVTYQITQDDLDTNYPIQLGFKLKSYAALLTGISGNLVTQTISGSQYYCLQYLAADVNITNVKLIKPTNKVTSFKKGAYHKFGIVYYDYANRDGGVATDPTFVQYVKTFPELFPSGVQALDTDNGYQSYIDISISHIPPIWANKYQLVRAKNNLSKYVQFLLKVYPPGTPTIGGNIEIDLTYLMYYKNNSIIAGSLDFQFEEGDRLRFLANADYYCPEYVEVSVLAFNTTNNILTVSYFDWENVYGNMATTTSEGMLVEYFAYSKVTDEENQLYYEIGEVFEIISPGTPNRRHQGLVDGVPSNQNAAHTVPATVRLRRGDTYIYRRYLNPPTAGLMCIVESENYSDFYASANFDISRVQIVRNETTKQHGQQLRYGGRYFPDTLTNNLLTFDGANFDTLLTTYGPINKVLTIGYVLKCLQTKKLTSIYINRSMTFNADGTPQIILTNQVLGTKDPSNLDYGCVNPESVCRDERQMYFFDLNTGAFIQDSANGPFPISNYKMSTYFKNKAASIRNAPNNDKIFVYACSDNFNETINVTFSDENTVSDFNNQTIIYLTRNNRWISFHSYIGDYMVSNALVLVSFKDGSLYLHNDISAPRCNFYGVQYSSSVKFVCNINPETVKVYDSIAINSNKLWTSPNDTDITTPANGTYPIGMASRLVEGKFRKKEGVWYADYLRDLNTANVTNPILNGQRLRGLYMLHRIENSDTTQVILFSVLVKSTYSPISG